MHDTRSTHKSLDSRVTELPDQLPLFLTADEVAQIFGCSSKHIRDCAREGKIAGVRIGNAWRIPRRVLEDFMGEHHAC